MWDNRTGTLVTTLTHSLADNDSLVDVICYTDHLVTRSKQGHLYVWEISSFKSQEVLLEDNGNHDENLLFIVRTFFST